jgi:uncharacterized protein YjiS (DUF1127 family)
LAVRRLMILLASASSAAGWPDRSARQAAGATAGACLRAGLRQLVAPVRRWHRAQRDARQLMALDDHLLQDIGLSRDEIERALRAGRDRI